MKRSKRNAIIFILMLTLVLISCIFNPKPRDKWVKGQLIVNVHTFVFDEVFEEFLYDYKEYELKPLELLSPRSTISRYYFNDTVIDVITLENLLRNDARVEFALVLEQGIVAITLYGMIIGKSLDRFLQDYSEYNLIPFAEIHPRYISYILGFNHMQIDCEVFLEIIKNDYRVDIAQFNHYLYLEFGEKKWKDVKYYI